MDKIKVEYTLVERVVDSKYFRFIILDKEHCSARAALRLYAEEGVERSLILNGSVANGTVEHHSVAITPKMKPINKSAEHVFGQTV